MVRVLSLTDGIYCRKNLILIPKGQNKKDFFKETVEHFESEEEERNQTKYAF